MSKSSWAEPAIDLADAGTRFGRINVLVNNASAQNKSKNFVDIDLDKVEDIFQTNIIQMMALTKFALPHMSRGDAYVLCSQHDSPS